jgi:hypothetical protein
MMTLTAGDMIALYPFADFAAAMETNLGQDEPVKESFPPF